MSRRGPAWFVLALALVTGCGSGPLSSAAVEAAPQVDLVPGLPAAEELILVAMPPHPSDAGFHWTRAYHIADLPVVNLGQPSPTLVAGSESGTRRRIACTGSAGDANCRPVHGARPFVAGERFPRLDVMAWIWVGVPDQTSAVQFTDQTGSTAWQRPRGGVVIFPDVVRAGDDCECRLDAFGSAGELLAAVDVSAKRYIDI